LAQVKLLFDGALTCHQGDNSKYQLNRKTVTNESTFRKNKIACIIASYNYGDFLIEAIESVLKQTILPDEILISDDYSTDETELIARGYVNRYPKLIKYNRNSKNLGIIDHFNSAIKLIKSDFVFFLGADNRLQSDYIEKTFQVLNSDPKIGIAYTDYSFFGDNAKLAFLKMAEAFQGEIIDNTIFQINFPEFDCNKVLKDQLSKGNFIHGSSMFRLSAFNDVGGYMKSKGPEDYNLFTRMLESNWNAKKAYTNLEYRQHSHSQSNNTVIIQNKLLFYKEAYEKLLKEKQLMINSKAFNITLKLFKLLFFIRKNYRSPKLIISKIYNKLK
jgi:glycosyltransferase involved in cell wall biosynthesis